MPVMNFIISFSNSFIGTLGEKLHDIPVVVLVNSQVAGRSFFR